MSEPVWALPDSVRVGTDGNPRLVGGQCTACSLKLYPCARVCPECWSKEITPVDLSRRGTLYTYTIVHAGRPGWQTPYAIAYVDLDDGVRVCGPIDLDGGEVPRIGSAVVLTTGVLRTDEKGVTHLSHRFKTIESGASS
jgi:uncharacterized OB-fold protein